MSAVSRCVAYMPSAVCPWTSLHRSHGPALRSNFCLFEGQLLRIQRCGYQRNRRWHGNWIFGEFNVAFLVSDHRD